MKLLAGEVNKKNPHGHVICACTMKSHRGAGSEAIIQRHEDRNFLPISREIRHMHRIKKMKRMDGLCVFALLQLKPHFITEEENALNYLCVVHICNLVWPEV